MSLYDVRLYGTLANVRVRGAAFQIDFFFKVNRKQGEKEKPMIEPEYEISGVDRCMSNAGTVFDWKFFLRKGRGERVCSLDWTIALLWM